MTSYRIHLSRSYCVRYCGALPLWKRIALRVCGIRVTTVVEP